MFEGKIDEMLDEIMQAQIPEIDMDKILNAKAIS